MKVTELLAIYGASLSTIVFAWNISRAIPRIKVDIIFAIEEVEGEQRSGVYISVKNPSPHTVHLSNVSLLYPYKKCNLIELITHTFKYRRLPFAVGWVHTSLSFYAVEDGCPFTLEAGKAHNIFVPDQVLDEILKDCTRREIKAEVQDQLWRNKYSRKFKYS